MKRWPEVDVKIKKVDDLYRAQAKTKVPCGVVVIETVDTVAKASAKALATRTVRNTARIHIIEHGCSEG